MTHLAVYKLEMILQQTEIDITRQLFRKGLSDADKFMMEQHRNQIRKLLENVRLYIKADFNGTEVKQE